MTGTPRYRQIAGEIREQIARGKYPPGGTLPTEAELGDTYGVARQTARAALDYLVRIGVALPGGPARPRRVAHAERLPVHLARLPGRTSPGESPSRYADSWLGDMRAAGCAPTQDLHVYFAQADAALAERLEVAVGSTVAARQLLRQADGNRNLITFWFPAAVASGTPLGDPADITEGSMAWLERVEGELEHDVEIIARPPGEDEERELAIPAGTWVAEVWRTVRRAGVPMATSVAVFRADQTRLVIDW